MPGSIYSSKKLLIQALVSTLYGVLIYSYITFSEKGDLSSFGSDMDTLSLFIITSWVVFTAFSFVTKGLNRIRPWTQGTPSRFFFHFIVNSLVALVLIAISLWIFVAIKHPNQSLGAFLSNSGDATLKFIILFLLSNIVYILINLYQYSYTSFIQANIESEKMIRERLKLQYDILKSQLSPHYLFNTLNTIASLLHRDITTTESFVRRFAKTFSYILRSHQKDLVTVKEELDFIEAYYFMLQIRFENALHLSINISEAVKKTYIPPMTLQLLVENAVKHNHFDEEKPLNILIESSPNNTIKISNNFERKPGFIEVENQLVKKPLQHISHKVGLENIKKRYSYFSKQGLIIDRDKQFTVQLPLIINLP
ncbi:sensor histidine kinase [Carboxylicivirga linearis]|uniref:Histidine kinase n=1 Tax=Carboxylicivirga linearis TaxID=1628157 RepID=A0ABS5JVT5_9BACT|nr:histidine kinase [Carboxylicivirga linearis]MBS2099017.1 histidine kinase [Carboxylicivirga linearis]